MESKNIYVLDGRKVDIREQLVVFETFHSLLSECLASEIISFAETKTIKQIKGFGGKDTTIQLM